MPDQDFTLVVTGTIDDETVERLFEAALDDATVRSSGGVGFVDVTREAPTMAEAVASAIRQVRSAGLEVREVEPGDLVTMSAIAERLGRTRESVRLLIEGERGPGGFPPATSPAEGHNRRWRWMQVARWAELPPEEIERAEAIAAVNARLNFGLYETELGKKMVAEVARMMAKN